jgi:hypothetical protein
MNIRAIHINLIHSESRACTCVTVVVNKETEAEAIEHAKKAALDQDEWGTDETMAEVGWEVESATVCPHTIISVES